MKKLHGGAFVLSTMWLALFAGVAARGDFIGQAVPLDELVRQSDIVFKGTAILEKKVREEAFDYLNGYACYETEFEVASAVKGERPSGRVRFRHYDVDPSSQRSMVSSGPQVYHFEPGKTYLIFAKRDAAAPGVFQQLWMGLIEMPDEGVVPCHDDHPAEGRTVKEILWSEWLGQLKSEDEKEILSAVEHLDAFSGEGIFTEDDSRYLYVFERKDVLTATHALMNSPLRAVAERTIALVGSHNVYLWPDADESWLTGVGGSPPQKTPTGLEAVNVGGKLYRDELVALADGKREASTRALAVAALGMVRDPALREPILRWLGDPAVEVRRAAVRLLADFPGLATRERLDALAGDLDTGIRVAVAEAVSDGRLVERTVVLSKLLHDKEALARKVAAAGLLSFEPTVEPLISIYRGNLGNEEFGPLFLLGLAHLQPEQHLDALTDIVRRNLSPPENLGRRLPASVAWEILFKYLRSLPQENLASGKFDGCLDALESPGDTSSHVTYSIYAFYLQRDMTKRAKNYRRKATAPGGEADWRLAEVTKNPSRYVWRDEDNFYQ